MRVWLTTDPPPLKSSTWSGKNVCVRAIIPRLKISTLPSACLRIFPTPPFLALWSSVQPMRRYLRDYKHKTALKALRLTHGEGATPRVRSWGEGKELNLKILTLLPPFLPIAPATSGLQTSIRLMCVHGDDARHRITAL